MSADDVPACSEVSLAWSALSCACAASIALESGAAGALAAAAALGALT